MGLPLKPIALTLVTLLLLAAGGLAAYGAKGWRDAHAAAPELIRRAEALIAADRGAEALGTDRADWLLAVQDPGFAGHAGVDLSTPGAGITTLTQSLSKRLAFDDFHPGLGKIRQTGFALGLETRLTKAQIFALFLDTVEMGRGPDGWMTGFFTASQAIHGRPPSELDRNAFLGLVAVMIAPGRLSALNPDTSLNERVGRIDRMLRGACAPDGPRDVWLDGCTEKEIK